MLTGKKATAAPAENAQQFIIHMAEPEAFRNPGIPTTLEGDARLEHMHQLYHQAIDANWEKGKEANASKSLLCFVSDCYFERYPFSQVLHFLVYNQQDTAAYPLWQSIKEARCGAPICASL